MLRIFEVIGACILVAGCIGQSRSSSSSSSEPKAESHPKGPTLITDDFERWFERTKRPSGSGGIANQAGQFFGCRVRWQLNSMGYEVNTAYDPDQPTGPDNWKNRMRLFAGSLDPGSDLGQVYDSAYPVILAVLPNYGTGYDEGERRARLLVEGTLWGVSGGELFLKDYTITAAAGTGSGTAPMEMAGPSLRSSDDVAEAALKGSVVDVEIIERLASNPATAGHGELVIITPHQPGETSDGHRVSWIDLHGNQLFPGVEFTGVQPSKVTPRNVEWAGALWFDNGHCWHGVELVRTSEGPYASLKWLNLGPDAESKDCGMKSFAEPSKRKGSRKELSPGVMGPDFEL